MEEDPSTNSILQKLSLIGQQQLKRGNLRKAKAAFEYLYKKAKISDRKGYQEASQINLAATYIEAKEPANAINCLQTALTLALDLPHTNYGDIHYNLAIAHEMLDHLKDASKEYDSALAAYKESERSSSEVISNTAIKAGMLHLKFGRYKKANECFDVSASKLSEKSLVIQLATVLCMKAKCLVMEDNTVPEAIQVCEEGLKLCKSLKQDLFVVNLCNELGLILTQSKQYKRSAECYKLGLAILEDHKDEEIPQAKKAALLQNLGAVFNSIGKYQEAAGYSLRAADIYGVAGVRSSQCHCFLNIAYSFSRLKTQSDAGKCEEYYLHALQAAKDTGCMRDQWQACEGLAGAAVFKGQHEKAISYYQKAIGACATTGSNTHEQDRLVKKMSAVIRKRPPFSTILSNPDGQPYAIPMITVQSANSPHLNLMHLNNGTSPGASSHSTNPPATNTNVRPVNINAARVTAEAEPSSEVVNEAGLVAKRKGRKISRRNDREGQDVYGVSLEPVHRGLGKYQSVEDQTYPQHLSPKHIVNKGRRRRYRDEDGISVASGVHIKGLAVTLEDLRDREPRVGSSNRRRDFDEVDAGDVVRVRPMSRHLKHRRSRLALSCDSEVSEDGSENMGYDSIDLYDEYVSSDSENFNDTESADSEIYSSLVKGKVTDPKLNADRLTNSRRVTPAARLTRAVRPNTGKRLVADASGLFRSSSRGILPVNNALLQTDANHSEGHSHSDASDEEYHSEDSRGREVKDDFEDECNSEESRGSAEDSKDSATDSRGSADDSDHDIMNSKNSEMISGETSGMSRPRPKKYVRLDVDSQSSGSSEDGAQDIKDYEQELIRQESAGVETDDESDIEEDEDYYDTDGLKFREGLPVETYEKVDGVNFFKHNERNPTYSTIDAVPGSSMPSYRAPPQLPKRNYDNEDTATKNGQQSAQMSSDDNSADTMSRGQRLREQYLHEKHKKLEKVKVVLWEQETKKQSAKSKSKVCSVM